MIAALKQYGTNAARNTDQAPAGPLRRARDARAVGFAYKLVTGSSIDERGRAVERAAAGEARTPPATRPRRSRRPRRPRRSRGRHRHQRAEARRAERRRRDERVDRRADGTERRAARDDRRRRSPARAARRAARSRAPSGCAAGRVTGERRRASPAKSTATPARPSRSVLLAHPHRRLRPLLGDLRLVGILYEQSGAAPSP